jgi:hypothetical protein
MAEAGLCQAVRRHQRSIAIPIAFRSNECQREPVADRLAFIVQQQGSALAVYDQSIDPAIIVIVADHHAAPDDGPVRLGPRWHR